MEHTYQDLEGSGSRYFLDEGREVLLLEKDDIGLEIVLHGLNAYLLGHFVELVSEAVLVVDAHSHRQAELALDSDPVGDEGLDGATALVLSEHGHQEVCQSDQREGMLKEEAILGVSADVGDAHRVCGDQMIALHHVSCLFHQGSQTVLAFFYVPANLLGSRIEQVIGLPETFYLMLLHVSIGESCWGCCFKDGSEYVYNIRGHIGCRIVQIPRKGKIGHFQKSKFLSGVKERTTIQHFLALYGHVLVELFRILQGDADGVYELIQFFHAPILPELHLGEEIIGVHHTLKHRPVVHHGELKAFFLCDLPSIFGLA